MSGRPGTTKPPGSQTMLKHCSGSSLPRPVAAAVRVARLGEHAPARVHERAVGDHRVACSATRMPLLPLAFAALRSIRLPWPVGAASLDRDALASRQRSPCCARSRCPSRCPRPRCPCRRWRWRRCSRPARRWRRARTIPAPLNRTLLRAHDRGVARLDRDAGARRLLHHVVDHASGFGLDDADAAVAGGDRVVDRPARGATAAARRCRRVRGEHVARPPRRARSRARRPAPGAESTSSSSWTALASWTSTPRRGCR